MARIAISTPEFLGGTVDNPATALCQVIGKLRDKNGRVAIPGFYDEVKPLSAFERRQMARTPFKAEAYRKFLGVPKLLGERGYTPVEQRSARPTLEINGLTSGYQGDWLLVDLPSLDTLYQRASAPSTRILDRPGRVLYEISDPHQGRHTPIKFGAIPAACREATIATEDANYYSHPGVDVTGIVRALWINLQGGEILSGGSTITQQLARNLLPSPDERSQRTLTRKLRESILAWRLNQSYSKDQILELYLNRVYFGAGTYGVDAAARKYFGRSARDVSIFEAAMLAGMLKAPSRYTVQRQGSGAAAGAAGDRQHGGGGGVHGAIAETAEAVFADQFTPEQQEIARRIFLRLTELGEDSGARDTRRRATFNELILKPEQAVTTRAVLKALADARLIITSEDSAEVAHEALIREWPTLHSWLEENRESLRLHRQLTEAAHDWSKMDQDSDLLYRGARLGQAREWASGHADEMNALEYEFLAASVEASERQAEEREAQQRRELEAACGQIIRTLMPLFKRASTFAFSLAESPWLKRISTL